MPNVLKTDNAEFRSSMQVVAANVLPEVSPSSVIRTLELGCNEEFWTLFD